MKRLDRALDEFLGDMARENRSPRSRDDYFRHLVHLFEHLPRDPVTEYVDRDSIRATVDGWANTGPATRYKVDSIFRAFCKWLYLNDHVDRNPMDKIPRPKRPHPDDVPLRALSARGRPQDVRRLQTWRELLCLSTLAYFGSRRGAV